MRIATWNINGIRARLDYIALWLEERQPDIVGFQELKAQDEAFPHGVFNELGYTVQTHGQKSWNGVAVATKESVEVTQKGLPGREENGARLITAQVEDLSFTTVYCPNGKNVEHADYAMKLAWFDALNEYCQDQLSKYEQVVVCGDFNIVAQPLDSHLGRKGDGDIFHTESERDRLSSLFKQGLHDIYRVKYPDSDAYSWWDYRAGAFQRNMGLRIDLILGTQAVFDRTREVVIDRDYRKKKEGLTASDHTPVYIDID
ncbi:MAG: exodeoxyribonuclease III [Gammaproteobacteria bacterium]|nr:exodeoxyribonuclease III [Gammaproteobacteria bacterium]